MKFNYEGNQICLYPENQEEERLCKAIIRRMTDSNNLMGWYGDCKIEGKETSAYKVSWLLGREPGKGLPMSGEEAHIGDKPAVTDSGERIDTTDKIIPHT